MNVASFLRRNWPHFLAIGLFFIIGFIYFSKQLDGYGLKQHDIEQHIGGAHETAVYREHHNGEEPLWTNSMFGGMPTMQISTIYDGNWFAAVTTAFLKLFPPPMGVVLLYMIGFYLAMLFMKVNNWVALVGALAFGFLSYDIIILQAGHNSKGVAVAFMAPVVGAMWLAYRRNWIWGAVLSAVFMAFEMAANHLQVTYYLGFVLLGLGIAEVYRAIRDKSYGNFFKASGAILGAYFLALLVNYGNIKNTADYAKHTIRGANDLTMGPDGTSNSANATSGLNRDYVTEYSYGKDESFNLISPYVKGAGTMAFADSPFKEKIENSDLSTEDINAVLGSIAYWGEQPATSGPAYIGVILVLLALLGMVYIKDPSKYAFLAVAILTLMLSWGKNFMSLTDWFLDNVPGYDKFRAVTIIMVIVELCVCLLAVLFLDKLIKERERIKENIKPFYITTGGFLLVLIIVKFAGVGTYFSTRENGPGAREQQEQAIVQQLTEMDPAQRAQYGIDINNAAQMQQVIDQQMEGYDARLAALKEVREDIFHSSMNRSIGFAFFAALALFLLFYTSIPTMAGLAALGLLIVLDGMLVARNYLNNEEQGSGFKYWESYLNTRYPITPSLADETIMQQELAENPELKSIVDAGAKEGREKAEALGASIVERQRIEKAYAFAALNEHTNYRVFDFTGAFNSARASFLHKSIGGYHGAKLRNIQNLFEFHLSRSNNRVMNMLNIKYLIQPSGQDLVAVRDTNAMGNAWFVRSVKVVPDADTEIRALGSRFELTNAGTGKLLINGNESKGEAVYGTEKLQYLVVGRPDTINVPISNGVPAGMEVCIVSDVNGNVQPVPRQTMELDTAKSFTLLATYRKNDLVDLKTEAVIRKDEAAKLSRRTFKGEGEVRMTSYAPNKLNYSVNATDNAMVVFSEIYYPEGWTATVDGKPTEIVRVNYLLRGLEIPKGNHKVEFKFDLPKFHTLNTVSMLVSALVLLAFISVGVYFCKQKPEEIV